MFPELLARLRHAFTGDADAQATIAAVARATHISGMDRRAFLKTALIGAAVAATVDVEQLLWSPGTRTIFLPEAPTLVEADALVNGLVTPEWITREALRLLKNELTLISKVNRTYDDSYAERGAMRGTSPMRLLDVGDVKGFQVIVPTSPVVFDRQVSAVLSRYHHGEDDKPQEFIERRVRPAMRDMARLIVKDGIDVTADLPLPVGVDSATRLSDRRSGLSLRGVQMYDIQDDRTVLRFDLLGGKKA